MRRQITLVYCLMFSFLISCETYVREKGNGIISTQERAVETFNEIELDGNFEVLLRKSAAPGLTITTDENLHEYIKTNVKREVLGISSDRRIKSKAGVKLIIDYSELIAITSGGAVVVKNEDLIQGDYLRLEMSGAGAMNLNLDLKALKIRIPGAGAITLRGNAQEQNIEMSGAGQLDAYDLVSQKAKVEISGVGGASVNVKEKLEAKISGVGGILYKGKPNEVISNVSGLGTISRHDREDGENGEL